MIQPKFTLIKYHRWLVAFLRPLYTNSYISEAPLKKKKKSTGEKTNKQTCTQTQIKTMEAFVRLF